MRENEINDNGTCRDGGKRTGIELVLYLGVVFATFFVSFYAVSRRIAPGMYAIKTSLFRCKKQAADKPPFISITWWIVAHVIDQTALIMAVIGSFIILYESDDAVKIILSVVSMWFIVESKWILVTKLDMKLLQKWFSNNFTTVPDSYLVKNVHYAYEPSGFAAFFLWVEKLYALIVYLSIVCVSVAAPIWMIKCY